MNTCGTCKYFGRAREQGLFTEDGNYEEQSAQYHVCDLIQHINGYDRETTPNSQQVAGVIDGSGWFAALCVTDEFGCNQWTAK